MVKWLIIVFIGISWFCAQAQDPHFSQYYSSPLYLSPSLAGSGGEPRLSMTYRNQWPGIAKTYETYAVGADLYMGSYNSGLGFIAYQDKAGSAGLKTNLFGAQYSYRLQVSQRWQIVPGMQVAMGQKSIDFSQLRFSDEMNANLPPGSSEQLNSLYMYGGSKISYFDMSVSILAASQSLWAGITLDHLTEPNTSFLAEDTRLGFRMVGFGGFNVWTEHVRKGPARVVSLNWRYEYQDNFNQMDLGLYWYNEIIDFGVWFRGLPIIDAKGPEMFNNKDAIVFIVQYKFDNLKIGYSYDLTMSSIGSESVGAHEISVILNLANFSIIKRLKTKSLSCFPVGKDGRYLTRTKRRMRF